MPYHTPLRKKGVEEKVFPHAVKLCWFHIKFEDIHNKIPLKKFCEDFEEIVVLGGIWEKVTSEFNIKCDLHKDDGTIRKPNYDKLFGKKGWINHYEWKEQYPIFKADMLIATENSEREKYIRYKSKLNQNDYDSLDTCYSKEEEYKLKEKNGKDMTYYRNKNNETISNIDDRLRKRNGLDKTNINFEGNVNADVNANVKQETSAEVKMKKLTELQEKMKNLNYD